MFGTIVVVVTLAGGLGCSGGGDGAGDGAGGVGGGDGGDVGEIANQAPVWGDAPAGVVEVEEGRTLELPFSPSDADGDEVSVSVSVSVLPEGGGGGGKGLGGAGGIEVEAADGKLKIHAGYGAAGEGNFAVTLDDGRGATSEYEVAVSVRPLAWLEGPVWTAGADGPLPREHASVIVDAAGGRILVYAGSGYSPQFAPLADAWAFDPAARSWTELGTSGDAPAGGGSRRVAQAPGGDEAWTFGGYTGPGPVVNELHRLAWTEDALDFEAVAQVGAPPARSLHAFAYDDVAGRFAVFGGVSAFGVLGDLWTMEVDGEPGGDGAAVWTEVEVAPGDGPTPRYGFFTGQDHATGRLFVWSGAQGTAVVDPADDTWVLHLREDPPRWEQAHPGGGDAPPGRRNGCAVFDPKAPALFVHGGTADGATSQEGLFVFDARPDRAAWSALEIGGLDVRSSGFGVWDPATDRGWCGFGNSKAKIYTDFEPLGFDGR